MPSYKLSRKRRDNHGIKEAVPFDPGSKHNSSPAILQSLPFIRRILSIIVYNAMHSMTLALFVSSVFPLSSRTPVTAALMSWFKKIAITSQGSSDEDELHPVHDSNLSYPFLKTNMPAWKKLLNLGCRILPRGRLRIGRYRLVSGARKVFQSFRNGVDPLAHFSEVLSTAKLGLLPELACSIRHSALRSSPNQSLEDIATTCNVENTTVDPTPLAGSFNVLFSVCFSDGIRWIIKIPAAGVSQCWDAAAARVMESEALTMRFWKRETSIPIPTVHAYDTSLDNRLGCPYIVMDHIDSYATLYGLWFGTYKNKERKEEVRRKALKSLAELMVQLTSFEYQQSGSLAFNGHGNPKGTQPARLYDFTAIHKHLLNGTRSVNDPFHELGPFDDVPGFFFHLLGRRQIRQDPWIQGRDMLLRLFIEWCSEGHLGFGLAHPDFDLQNVLVNKDGTVCGIIDWDGVAAVPRCMGCESYPKWLTRDWDPFYHMVDDETGLTCEDSGRPEQPAEELAYYRSLYSQYMGDCMSSNQTDGHVSLIYPNCQNLPRNAGTASTTRRSLLVSSLYAAVDDPSSTNDAFFKIFEEIRQITANKRVMRIAGGFADNIQGDARSAGAENTDSGTQEIFEQIPSSIVDIDPGIQEATEIDPSNVADESDSPTSLQDLAYGLQSVETDRGLTHDCEHKPDSTTDCHDSELTAVDHDSSDTGNLDEHCRSEKQIPHDPRWSRSSWRKKKMAKILSWIQKAHLSSELDCGLLGTTIDPPQLSLPLAAADQQHLGNIEPCSPSNSARTSSSRTSPSSTLSGDDSQETACTEVTTGCVHGAMSLTGVNKGPEGPHMPAISEQGLSASSPEAAETAETAKAFSEISPHRASSGKQKHLTTPSPPSSTSRRSEGGCFSKNKLAKKAKKVMKAPGRALKHVVKYYLPWPPRVKKLKAGSDPLLSNQQVEMPQTHAIDTKTYDERVAALQQAAAQKSPHEPHKTQAGINARPCSLNADNVAFAESHKHGSERSVDSSDARETTAVEASPLDDEKALDGGLKVAAEEDAVDEEEEQYYVDENFFPGSVLRALADGTLDEARMRRLKDGFFMLLNSS